MSDIYPEERAWVRAVRRGDLNIPVALEVLARPVKFYEPIGSPYADFFDDLLYPGVLTNLAVYGTWLCALGGAGTVQANQADVHPGTGRRCHGMLLLSTIGAAGLASMSRSTLETLFGAGTGFRVACRLRIPQLNGGGEEFAVQFGWHDQYTVGTVNAVDGVYFEHNSTSANWVCVSRSNSVETRTATATPVVDSRFDVLEIEVAESGSHAWFRINGDAVATHSTNIPVTDDTRTCGLGFRIFKTVGAANRTLRVDWVREQLHGSAAR